MCAVLDKLLIKHNRPFDDMGWESLVEDFISVSAPEGIDEATLFIAYMNWMNQQEKFISGGVFLNMPPREKENIGL